MSTRWLTADQQKVWRTYLLGAGTPERASGGRPAALGTGRRTRWVECAPSPARRTPTPPSTRRNASSGRSSRCTGSPGYGLLGSPSTSARSTRCRQAWPRAEWRGVVSMAERGRPHPMYVALTGGRVRRPGPVLVADPRRPQGRLTARRYGRRHGIPHPRRQRLRRLEPLSRHDDLRRRVGRATSRTRSWTGSSRRAGRSSTRQTSTPAERRRRSSDAGSPTVRPT